jgi:hypothetical protein
MAKHGLGRPPVSSRTVTAGGPGVVVCDLATGTCTTVTQCSPGANTVCNGQITNSVPGTSPAADAPAAVTARRTRAHRRSIVIGRGSFVIPAGRRKAVVVRLNRIGMRLLRLYHQLRVLQTITSHDKAGHHWTHTRWIMLRLAKARVPRGPKR